MLQTDREQAGRVHCRDQRERERERAKAEADPTAMLSLWPVAAWPCGVARM